MDWKVAYYSGFRDADAFEAVGTISMKGVNGHTRRAAGFNYFQAVNLVII